MVTEIGDNRQVGKTYRARPVKHSVLLIECDCAAVVIYDKIVFHF